MVCVQNSRAVFERIIECVGVLFVQAQLTPDVLVRDELAFIVEVFLLQVLHSAVDAVVEVAEVDAGGALAVRHWERWNVEGAR